MPGVGAAGDREDVTTVVVTVWRHGDDIVGRVTPVQQPGTLPSPGRACASLDDVCDALRDLVELAVPTPAAGGAGARTLHRGSADGVDR